MSHFYTPKRRADALFVFEDVAEEVTKKNRKLKQAVFVQIASLLHMNESTLDWLTADTNMTKFIEILFDALSIELKDILLDDCEDEGNYTADFLSVHCPIADELEQEGRKEHNFMLDWWRDIKRTSILAIRKRKLSRTPIFIDFARASSSIQA